MHELRNLDCRNKLKERLENETEPRRTVSFYKYARIENPQEFRDELFVRLREFGVFGRIYVAYEGINAQVSVPEQNFEAFKNYLDLFSFLKNLRLNVAVEDDGKSFWFLKIKVKEKIVADGITDESFNVENRGEYLTAERFNEITNDPEVVVVDMRNYYEYEVGHFENAVEIPSDTFSQQLPAAVEMLEEKKDTPIVMYCTGGIRCEKASAYLRHKGFKQVFHLEGGIIKYVHDTKEKGLENKFKGKNFVFDKRFAERITDDVLSNCHQCGSSCDTHTNCENKACHVLFIQCEACKEKFEGCCSDVCREIHNLPEDVQKELRKGKKNNATIFCNSRVRKKMSLQIVSEPPA